MPIAIEIRNLGTGRPVKPDFTPRIPGNVAGNTIPRSIVKSASELAQKNLQDVSPSPPELGRAAGRISQQFASGKIDILA